jgi:hypothetical protein
VSFQEHRFEQEGVLGPHQCARAREPTSPTLLQDISPGVRQTLFLAVNREVSTGVRVYRE